VSQREEREVDDRLGQVVEASNELAPDEEGGEDVAPTLGVGLQVQVELQCAGSQTDQPHNECGERAEQREHLEAHGNVAARIAKPEAPAMTLQVAESLSICMRWRYSCITRRSLP
jgi:hypothetical protein